MKRSEFIEQTLSHIVSIIEEEIEADLEPTRIKLTITWHDGSTDDFDIKVINKFIQ